MILGEKIERKVYVNQQNFASDIQPLTRNYCRKEVLPERDRLETCIWW